jgi:phage-related protein
MSSVHAEHNLSGWQTTESVVNRFEAAVTSIPSGIGSSAGSGFTSLCFLAKGKERSGETLVT